MYFRYNEVAMLKWPMKYNGKAFPFGPQPFKPQICDHLWRVVSLGTLYKRVRHRCLNPCVKYICHMLFINVQWLIILRFS